MTTAETAKRPLWRTLVGTGSGNALEWFDWNIYAVFTPFFASQFFAPGDPTAAMLSSLAVFAVGFLMRPLGGLLFGWLADRTGRRAAMTTSIGCAALGSLVIGCAPPYATLGVGASLILVLARLGQGLAHGGELPAAQTYIAEMAPHGRRGRWSSLIYFSGTCGVLGGTLVGAILSSVLSPDQLHAWGWRVPFIIGGLLGLYTLAPLRFCRRARRVVLDAVSVRVARTTRCDAVSYSSKPILPGSAVNIRRVSPGGSSRKRGIPTSTAKQPPGRKWLATLTKHATCSSWVGQVHDRVEHEVGQRERLGHRSAGEAPTVTGIRSAPGFSRSSATIAGDRSMPCTRTRSLSGRAIRPVPTPSSSAGPPPANSVKKSTAGSMASGANIADSRAS